ncbi:MAG: YezD family protein [Terracidiphilus sp.]
MAAGRDGMNKTTSDGATDIFADLASDEHKALRVVAEALRSIRYGSVVLTIHEGRLVELTKTVRSRLNPQ